MNTAQQIRLLASVLVCIAASTAHGVEENYYDRLASLLDTNNIGPTLTNTLSFEKLKSSGEVASVKLGMTMSQVVKAWGKPRTLYSVCGDGPRLSYKTASLYFRGDQLHRISLYGGALRFDNGLTGASTEAQFVRVLGPGESDARRHYRWGSVALALTFVHPDGLGWIDIESPLPQSPSEK
jgi:hypothetical protein